VISIFQRSFFSIFGNALKTILSFFTGVILARGLGVENYGTFAFLLSSFTISRSLLEMGTSSAFFTFISKINRSKQFFLFYGAWLLFQFSIPIFFILLIAPESWIENIWQGQDRVRIILAFIAVFFQQTIWTSITHIGESQRLTIKVQKINISIAAFHLLAVALLFFIDKLSIESVFFIVAIEFFLAAIFSHQFFKITFLNKKEDFKKIIKEFKIYCFPLIPFVWISMVSFYANTWFLQKFGGSIEQAYYAIAVQFSILSFILISPTLNIFWKEMSELCKKGKLDQLDKMYTRVCRMLFIIPTIIAGLVIPWSVEIISFVLGDQYTMAAPAMQLMFIYSIWQSLGAIRINTFYALEFTKARTKFGIIFALISIPFTYLMIGPSDTAFPGLDYGAVGLAFKMLLLQIIIVNIYGWWISRTMKWKFDWFYQILVFFSCIGVGFFLYFLMQSQILEHLDIVFRFIIAQILYILFIVLIVIKKPLFLGMNRNDLKKSICILKEYLSIKKTI